MKYDFVTRVDRKKDGSNKWVAIEKKLKGREGIVPFSVADMEFKTPPEIKDGLTEFLDHMVLGYTSANDDYYKALISWMERKHNFKIEREWVVHTQGIVAGIFNAIRAYSSKGDGVIIMRPVYFPFSFAIERQERKIVNCPLIEDNGYYEIDFNLFEELAKDENNKILLFCSPHNPCGRVWTKEELEKIGKIVLDNNLLLLSDEIHSDIIMPGSKHIVFQTLSDDLAEKTITFTSPSKTFNLAGLGLSNIIIKNKDLRDKFKKAMFNVGINANSALGYKAGELAYNYCEGWLDEAISVIYENEKFLMNFFEKNYSKIKAPLSEGTYLSWIDFRDLGLDDTDLEKFLEDKAGIFSNMGYIFGDEGKGFVRLNLACPKDVLAEALGRLDAALKEINYK
ncbi:MalY/PatB family protein [uncultured Peptoniphilus sp.]|uniref:MalY/PatB family protein n=1 Tax=uncultured Peptoniphilus sp. TaxID=254354 RepID=UPI0028051DF4|nr:MalY/PatB family protein [uncultured Peptoniphilus sp.]